MNIDCNFIHCYFKEALVFLDISCIYIFMLWLLMKVANRFLFKEKEK